MSLNKPFSWNRVISDQKRIKTQKSSFKNECWMSHILWVTYRECTFLSKNEVHFWVRIGLVPLKLGGGGDSTEFEFWAGMSILSFGESRSSVRPWHPRDYNVVSTCHVMTSLIHLMQIIWYSFTIYNHMTNPSNFITWKITKFWPKISSKKVKIFQYFR